MKRNILAALVAALALAMGTTRAFADVVPATLHSFDEDDGRQPVGALIDGGDGHLYGTTTLGGDGVLSPAGTIFRISYAGGLTSLYTFELQVTGDRPYGRLLRAANGTLLGTTRGSGSFNGNVFGLTTLGNFASLHDFTGYFVGADGGHPEGGLAPGGDGNLYGVTTDGGASNSGALYRIAASGAYTLLHSFSLGLDGASPRGELVLEGGHLHGVTNAGGPTQPTPANGTVFRFTPGVSSVTTLHAFRGNDGVGPNSTLVKAPDGDFYGTTFLGGSGGGFGTVYKIAGDDILVPEPGTASAALAATVGLALRARRRIRR